ncbi:MAG TPA: PAS domain S-box protein [Urbifossiella sp.]|nr:PAS domain S-box protein [Urbifossiella sp.]
MASPIAWPFDVSGFVPRWDCGDWSAGLGWLHIASDLAIWLAYLAIPVVLVWFVRRRRDVPFPRVFWLFGLFIVACGTTHLLEAVIFYHPVYRLAGLVKLFTAVVSAATVAALVRVAPQALAMRTPLELEREVAARTADLAAANAALAAEVDRRGRAERDLFEQREWFRVVLASIGDAVVATDARHRVAFLNPAAEALTGWPAAEAAGRPLDEVVHTLDEGTRGRAESPAARVLREGAEVGLANHTLLVARGGAERIIERSAAPIRAADGAIQGVVLAVRDVTSQKDAEVGRARLAAIIGGTDDAIIAVAPDGAIQSWNPGAERLYGWAADEVGGRAVAVLVPPDKADERAAVMARMRRGEPVPSFETVRLTKEGRRVDVSVTLSPVRGADGAVIGYSKIARDIGPRKRAEEALRAQAERLRIKGRLLNLSNAMIRDPAGRIATWTDGMARLYGWTREEAEGRVSHELLRTRFPAPQAEIDAAVLRDGRWEGELTHTRADGGAVTVVSQWVLDRGEDGTATRVLEVDHDVTARRRVEEDLFREREFLRTVLDNISEGVLACDPAGRLTLSNRAAREIHGSGGPLPAEGWWDRFPQYWPDGTRIGYDDLPLVRAVRGNRVRDVEFVVARPDGGRRTVVGNGEPLADPGGNRIGAVLALDDVTDRRRAEEGLRLRDRVIGAASQGILITDPTRPDDPIIYVTPGFERLTGHAAAEVIGRNCRFLQGPDTDPTATAALRDAVAAGRAYSVELLNYRKDGTPFWNALSVTPVRDGDRVTHFVGVQTDVTDRRRLEDQLRQAQKMEAVGQLAGGVAHDFNNLLTVINGYSELLLETIPADAPDRPAMAAVREAGERAAGLTSQLLAFSRQSVLDPQVVDPNAVVAETARMLGRLIGEDVTLALALAPRAGRVRVDPGQFGQVLMNLAVNARDAMPTGGRLTIETRDVELDGEFARVIPGIRPGRYVLTAVTDSGVGMPPEVRTRVFEPFFTTKGPGRGTGLGLATVYGIVKQSGGHVEVYSEVGIGTTFKIYLPAVREDGAAVPEAEPVRARGGSERVLVVEDQDDVRGLAVVALQAHGYSVLEAADGPAALRFLDPPGVALDLLVTDVVMPGMSGRQLAEAVRAARPGLPVLFVSGYTDDAVVRHGILQAEVAFLRKPYTPLSLARKVREVLDAAR